MKRQKVNSEQVDKDNPEWTDADFARATPLSGLPRTLQQKLRNAGVRGPQKAATKKLVSLRLSPEVLMHYKATGPGWQTRIDQALKRVVSRAGRGGSEAMAIAEVLNHKRNLSIEMIRRLHEKLGIPAEVLIRPSRKGQAA